MYDPVSWKRNAPSLITHNFVMSFKNSDKEKCALNLFFFFLTLLHKTWPGENSNCNNSQIFLKRKTIFNGKLEKRYSFYLKFNLEPFLKLITIYLNHIVCAWLEKQLKNKDYWNNILSLSFWLFYCTLLLKYALIERKN